MRVARLWRRDMPPPSELPVQSTRAAARALDFAVDSFECIPVDEENALLRVRGEWGEAPTSSPALAVHVSGRTLLFEPLPAAPTATDEQDSSSWQAGYALPAAEITRAARFSLKVGTRSVTLPVPERSADLRHEETDDSATESDREPVSAGGAGVPDIQRITAWWAEDSERHIAALEQLRGELEVERSARADLYAEAVRLRAGEPDSETEIEELSAQLERAREVHEGDVAARDRLRRELEALTVVLSNVQDELRRATAVIEKQASDARAQQERLLELESRAGEAERAASEDAERVSDLMAQLEARTIERDGLARELEGLWGVGDELESVRAERATEAGDWQARLDAAAADAVRLEQERDELRSALEDARSRSDLESSGRSELESRLAAAEEARSLHEQRGAELSDRLETLSAERDELHAAQQEMSSRIAEQETALEEARAQAVRADEERSKLESRLEAAQLEVLERTERLSEVAEAMEQHDELATELGEARLTLERDAKRISELERRLDETLLAEERARETVAQHQEADSIRDHAMVELERTLADTRQQVFDLQEQLDEAREALRRGVGERLWQLEP
jgi:chromosome segregation ATPase